MNWRKSSRTQEGKCVELAVQAAGGTVAVRDSKNRDGGTQEHSASAMSDLIKAVKAGRYDL